MVDNMNISTNQLNSMILNNLDNHSDISLVAPLFINGNNPFIAIIDDDWGIDGQAHASKDVIEIQLGKQAKMDEFRHFPGSPFASVLQSRKQYDYLLLSINEMNNRAETKEIGWGRVVQLYQLLTEGNRGTPLNAITPDTLNIEKKRDVATVLMNASKSGEHTMVKLNNSQKADVMSIGQVLNDGLHLMRAGTHVFQASGDNRDLSEHQWSPLALLSSFNGTSAISGSYNRVGALYNSVFEEGSSLLHSDVVFEDLRKNYFVNAGFETKGVDLYAAGINPYSDDVSFSTRFAAPEAIVNHIQSRTGWENIKFGTASIGPDAYDLTRLNNPGLAPYPGEPGAAPLPGEPGAQPDADFDDPGAAPRPRTLGAAPLPGEIGSGIDINTLLSTERVNIDPAIRDDPERFLNGIKPHIAVIDDQWLQKDGHGTIVKDIFEVQLGQDGKRADITEFDSHDIDFLSSPFKPLLDFVAETHKPFDYVNLSASELANSIGWSTTMELYNELAPEGWQLNLVTPNELSQEQRKMMAETFISAIGNEDEYIDAIGKLLSDSLVLMKSGTNIYQAAGNDVDTGDNWGPATLLKAFNAEVQGSFQNVGSIDRDIHSSESSVENRPDVLKELLDINLVFSGYQLEDVSEFANGRTKLDQYDRYPGATSWATPEAITNDIFKKTGWDPIPITERASGVNMQDIISHQRS